MNLNENTQTSDTAAYQSFWNWFKENAKAFQEVVKEQGDVETDFLDKLAVKLNELREGFHYLTGMHDEHTAELIMTADGVIKNIPFVEDLVSAAPEIEGWKFTALKPALESVSIEMSGHTFSSEHISFYPNEDPAYPDEVDVTIVYKPLTSQNKSEFENGIFIYRDNFLGELRFSTAVDRIAIEGTSDVKKELIPVLKLHDYLLWREKEFVEKYEDARFEDEDSNYTLFKAKLKNGNLLMVLMNTDALQWANKPAYSWILTLEIGYDQRSDGMPDDATQDRLEQLEDELAGMLQQDKSCIRIGRQTGNGTREIYFAGKDFRQLSRVAYRFINNNERGLQMGYDIFKNKYWRSFSRFVPQA